MFVESIKLKDGKISLLDYHQERIDRTLHHLQIEQQLSLSSILKNYTFPQKGFYKIRVLYGDTISVECTPYEIQPKRRLQMVYDDHIDYTFKQTDRSRLQELYHRRGSTDDIIIIKNKLVTDSYYANLAFLKEGKWYTPELPLLNGTKRAFLLDQQQIVAATIYAEDIPQYEKVALFNALIDLEDELWISTQDILK